MRKNLDEAVAELKRDPTRPVRVRVDDLEVELRAVLVTPEEAGLGDRLAAAGPWEGEELDDLLQVLREARAAGGSAEAPDL
ncbi:MAG TPA: hypothetical protein VGQ83_28480 [Polyangia bacterium]|jgi:hypothetical protein